MTRAIGIDLGTSYTVVAAIQDGRPMIIPNAEGQRLTPSVVCFVDGAEPLVGEGAKQRVATLPERYVSSIKRRMGSGYTVKIGQQEYTPQEVSAFILRKVKADSERFLGEIVDRAVITVPAYFNDRQRQATKEAAVLAGLEVLRIINEPTSAALAYGIDREDAHSIVVWDLGGGTFDVSILELGEGIFEVRSVAGDSWLGGDDWDSRLAQYLATAYERLCGTAFPSNAASGYRLRDLAEKAKRELSSLPATTVRVSPVDRADAACAEVEVSRRQLEGITKDLLDRMNAPTHQALADAGLAACGIDRVILVGGSTRMPAVRELARTLFGREPYRYVQPDEVVAMGAAIQVGMLLGQVDNAVLLDVLPLSLGVETQGGLMAKIISRNTPVPATGSRIFTTAADYQTSMDLHVLQGERELAAECVSLGHFDLKDIPPALRGVAKVEVTFAVDVDGLVHLSAEEILSEAEVQVTVASTKSLDLSEIECLAEEARGSATQDREARTQVQARIEGENTLAAAEGALRERACPGLEPQAQRVRQAAFELRQALATAAPNRVKVLCQALRAEMTTLGRGEPATQEACPRS